MTTSRSYLLILLLLVGICSTSCGHKSSAPKTATDSVSVQDSLDFDFKVSFDYAKGIRVENAMGSKRVYIIAPDSHDTMATYILYRKNSPRPQSIPPKAIAIAVPCNTLACLSTTQIGALPILGLSHKIVGAASPGRIYNAEIAERVKRGEIKEIGQGMGKSIEQIAALAPEILLQDLSMITKQDEELAASGIHIVLYNEWKEQSLKGRAEWIKLVGMLFGRNNIADKAFKDIDKAYEEAKQIIAQEKEPIHIMYGQDYKGVWYLPGEYSYTTAMLHDAKIAFDYEKGQVTGSPHSFESIFAKHRNAKIWLCMTAGNIKTKEEFLNQNERYRHFEAAQNGKIFTDTKRMNKNGGNDAWENGLYTPAILLKDLIKITRPQLLPQYETCYWTELR